MKKLLTTLLALAAFSSPAWALSVGDKAPDFKLPSVRDQKVQKLSDYRGKVVLVNFWATWCPPCRAEIPGFQKVYEKYRKQGFVILGLSVDDNPKDVPPFLKDQKVTYPVLHADRPTIEAYGGIRAIPSSFLVDKTGKVTQTVVGGLEEAKLEGWVKPLLK